MADEKKPYHISVLREEALEYLNLKPNGVYVDATFGGGGHTRAMLEAEPTCKVLAFDWDLKALEMNGEPLQEAFPDRLTLIWANFTLIAQKLKKEGIGQVDGVLADFGTSFYQLTERAGFSLFKDSPLDMRMSPAHQKITAADIVNKATERQLGKIFFEYGEEPKSRAAARVIVQERKRKPFRTTSQLLTVLETVLGKKQGRRTHPATRVFQALRIEVNSELDNILAFLRATLSVIRPEGRLVCISFHSLEDRIVKQFFKEQSTGPYATAKLITKKVVTPSPDEVNRNPASRSARLRALEVIKK